MPQATAGHDVRIGYYVEDNGYGNLPADYNTDTDGDGVGDDWDGVDLGPFGVEAAVDTAEGSNAIQRVFEPGKRVAIDLLEMIFDGSFSVTFTLTNPWWLKAAFGQYSETTNTDSSTYTFNVNKPLSLGIVEAYVPSDVQRVLKGCFVTQITIDVSVEDQVNVSIDGAYADEEIQRVSDGDIDSIIDQPPVQGQPMTFVEGAVEVGGSIENYVQSMSLNLTTNVDPIREMGVRTTIDMLEKTLEPDVDLTKVMDADDEHAKLEELFGGTKSPSTLDDSDKATVRMTFDNGEPEGSGIERGDFSLTNTLLDSYGESGTGDPTATVEQSLSRVGTNITAEWETENADPLNA